MSMGQWQRRPENTIPLAGTRCRIVVLKLFHVKDPQIDTYQLADRRLKRGVVQKYRTIGGT